MAAPRGPVGTGVPPCGVLAARRLRPARWLASGSRRNTTCTIPDLDAPGCGWVPSVLTAASRTSVSGHGSAAAGSRNGAVSAASSGCGRTHPVAGGMMPAVIASAVFSSAAMPAAPRVSPMVAETAPSAQRAR